ncbi:hypothetical protein INT43_005671 [Umbelopsis isabellina]|uniref:HMG box domain-containing protein n=1 Tax=Mortierella isabellina TaxID=91625 RepID=A0A8H7PNJ8_MORIS|nr:hypothetical protein INT43_005671 [Umbelopsis isabellina]
MKLEEYSKNTSPTPSSLAKADKRIPRPSNCFIAYRMAIREKVIAGNPKMNGKEISQLAGKMWRSEPEYVKDHFKAIAEKLKAEHTSKYPNYSYSPRKRKNSCVHDSYSSCEESYNVDSSLNKKSQRESNRHETLEENTPSKDANVVCDEMTTLTKGLKKADNHTLSYIVQDKQRDQFELLDAAGIALAHDLRETNVRQEHDTDDLIANELKYAEDYHLLSSSCDYGLSDEAPSPSPMIPDLVSSVDSDWLQYSPYAYTPGYDSLYSYYVFES